MMAMTSVDDFFGTDVGHHRRVGGSMSVSIIMSVVMSIVQMWTVTVTMPVVEMWTYMMMIGV